MATIGSLVVNIGANVGGLTQGLSSAQQSLQKFGSKMSGIGRNLTAGITAPIAGIALVALNSAADFEQAMNVMQSVSGATASQMDALQAQALELGANTSFSAGEAAEAQLELAKAGMSVNDVLAATPGVLNLAAAGGLEVAHAAEISANALNSFGLEASESNRVADLLAATANSSSVEVTDLADSFKMVSAVASSYGFSIEEVSAALAIMGNNGLKGSDAGTSLKTMFMALAAPTDKAAQLMEDLGINVYDAQGNMNDLGTILASIETAMGGLTEEQQNLAMKTLFGADAARAMNILLKEGSGAYAEMEKTITKTGAAQEAADAKMKGLSGAIEYFKGTLDSVLIDSASPFLDTLNEIVRGAADMLGGITKLSPQVQKWGAIALAAAAAAGPLLLIVGGLATALSALMGPVGLVVGAVALLGLAWATDFGGIREKTAEVWAAVQPTLEAWRQWAAEKLPQAWAALKDSAALAWGGVAGAIESARASIATAIDGIQALWERFEPIFAPAIQRVKDAFGGLKESLAPLKPALDKLVAAFSGLWEEVGPIVTMIGGVIAAVLGGVALVAINLFAAAIEAIGPILTAVVEQITLTIETISTIIGDLVALVTALVDGDWTGAWNAAKDIMATFGAFVLGTLGNLYSVAQSIFTAIYDTVVGVLEDLGIDAAAILEGIKGWWKKKFEDLVGYVQPAIDAVNNVVDALQGAWDWLKSHVFKNPFSGWDFNPFNNGGEEFTPPTRDRGTETVNPMGFASGGVWPGGWGLVGERGPELVRLPAGSRIFDAGTSEEMLAGDGRVSIGPVYITQDLDWEEIRWRLAELTRRRG